MLGLESQVKTIGSTSPEPLGDFKAIQFMIQNESANDIFIGSETNQFFRVAAGKTFGFGGAQVDSDNALENFDGNKVFVRGAAGDVLNIIFPRG